jgi:hypothetical protein
MCACVLLCLGSLLLLSVLPYGVASALLPTGDQQCIVELNENLATVAGAQVKEIINCLKNGAKERLTDQTVEECVTGVRSDPNAPPLPPQKRVDRAKQKTITKVEDKCAANLLPFDPNDANTVNAAAVAEPISLIHAIFGSDQSPSR